MCTCSQGPFITLYPLLASAESHGCFSHSTLSVPQKVYYIFIIISIYEIYRNIVCKFCPCRYPAYPRCAISNAAPGQYAWSGGQVYRVEPLTLERWEDFSQLCRAMGPNRSCWCMWWRDDGRPKDLTSRERALQLVERSVHPVGLLAYSDEKVIGWAAVSPREEYPRLNKRRDTAPVDDQEGAWVLPCLFVVKEYRHKGVTKALVTAAVEFARSEGARVIEAVPGDPATLVRTPSASYTGTVGLFGATGFSEVARRTKKGRVVMRRDLQID